MKKFLIAAAIAALAAVPASAVTVLGATKIRITNLVPIWLQVSELQVFNFSNFNVALAANGGVASSNLAPYDAPYTPDKANDGLTNGDFFATPGFHSSVEDGTQYLDIDFASTDLSSFTLFGRTDNGAQSRDFYGYTIFSGNQVLTSGQIDLRNTQIIEGTNSATVTFDAPTSGVPEPQTWALLVAGFGLIGVSMRRRKSASVAA
jgi:hypothetical protein